MGPMELLEAESDVVSGVRVGVKKPSLLEVILFVRVCGLCSLSTLYFSPQLHLSARKLRRPGRGS